VTESALTTTPTGAAIAEQVIIKGDLAKLTEAERMSYYSELCRSLGLNPLTRPFEYIVLNGKLTLYPTRGAGDQLRSIRGITITGLAPSQVGDLLIVVASGRDRNGREDSSTGVVSSAGLKGEGLANAMMKAETKAKRRLTLSLAGLGWPDESEVVDIPSAQLAGPHLSLAERAAEKAAAVQAVERVEAVIIDLPEPPPLQAADRPDGILNVEDVNEGAPAVYAPWTRDRLHGAAVHAGIKGSGVTAVYNDVAGARSRAELTADDWAEMAKRLGLA
jgi:hypothetical protein